MYEEEIRKLLTSKKLLIGKDEVLKNIRKSLVQKVYISSNCPVEALADLKKYSKISGFELFETKVPNDELGTVCKKPFSIAIIGVLK
jgi:large subunit ribosomal protein L30e